MQVRLLAVPLCRGINQAHPLSSNRNSISVIPNIRMVIAYRSEPQTMGHCVGRFRACMCLGQSSIPSMRYCGGTGSSSYFSDTGTPISYPADFGFHMIRTLVDINPLFPEESTR